MADGPGAWRPGSCRQAGDQGQGEGIRGSGAGSGTVSGAWRQWRTPQPVAPPCAPTSGTDCSARGRLPHAYLLQLGLLLRAPAQQGVGKARSGVGGTSSIASGTGIGARHEVAEASHGRRGCAVLHPLNCCCNFIVALNSEKWYSSRQLRRREPGNAEVARFRKQNSPNET